MGAPAESFSGAAALGMPVRREPREDTIRVVEYTAFPRATVERPRVGFTRDLSNSGMCLGVDAAETPGTLVHVRVRDLKGAVGNASVARVVWCDGERDGRFWVGLELLAQARAARDLRSL